MLNRTINSGRGQITEVIFQLKTYVLALTIYMPGSLVILEITGVKQSLTSPQVLFSAFSK